MKRQERIRGFFWNCNPQDVETGPGGRSRERAESKGTSRFTREEGARCCLLADFQNKWPEWPRCWQGSLLPSRQDAECPRGCQQLPLLQMAPGGWTSMPGLGLAL